MPYSLITSRQWPETRFEYAYETLEECEAVAAADTRLKRVRDYCIINVAKDRKLLARYQGPELAHLYRSLKTNDVLLPEKLTYNEILNHVAHALERVPVEKCPPKTLMASHRREQQPAENVKPFVAAVAQKPQEVDTVTKKPAPKAPARPASKRQAARKPAPKGKAATPAKKRLRAASTTPSRAKPKKPSKFPLGREGTFGHWVNGLIMAGKSDAQIEALADRSKTWKGHKSISQIRWYRWTLKTRGVKGVPESK